jgi:hypothetical protein
MCFNIIRLLVTLWQMHRTLHGTMVLHIGVQLVFLQVLEA